MTNEQEGIEKKVEEILEKYIEHDRTRGDSEYKWRLRQAFSALLPLIKQKIKLPKKKSTENGRVFCGYNRCNLDDEFNDCRDKVISLNKGAEIEEVE